MRPIIDDFCQIRRNSDVRFERAYCWHRKGSKQDLWCIMCTGALLMYTAVAIIPAASSFSQTRPIFHGVRKYIANSTTRMRTKPTRGVDLEGTRRDEQQREQRLGIGMEGLATCTEP